jgi:hypothetical protein
MDGSSLVSGSGGMPPPQMPPSASGGAPKNDLGGVGGTTPPDSGQKQFSLGPAGKTSGAGKSDHSASMEWARGMIRTWITQSNQQSQQWVESIADDEDLQ